MLRCVKIYICQNRCSTGAFVAIPNVHEWRAPTKRSARQNSAQGSFGPRLERSSNRKSSISSRSTNTTTTIATKRQRTEVVTKQRWGWIGFICEVLRLHGANSWLKTHLWWSILCTAIKMFPINILNLNTGIYFCTLVTFPCEALTYLSVVFFLKKAHAQCNIGLKEKPPNWCWNQILNR